MRTQDGTFIYVISEADGVRYKLILKGSLQKLTVPKIKQYLEKSTRVPASLQILRLNNIELDETTNLQSPSFSDILRGAEVVLTQRAAKVSSSPKYINLRSNTALDANVPNPNCQDCPAVYRSLFVDRSTSRSQSNHGKQGGHPSVSGDFGGRSRSSGSCGLSMMEHDGEGRSQVRSDSTALDAHMLQVENARLQRRVTELEHKCHWLQQEAANATSDWRLEEEMEKLRRELAEKDVQQATFVKNLNAKWQLKENDLIKELDRCREERRLIREEREMVAREQNQRITELQVELRLKNTESHEKLELISHLRQEIASLQSQLNPEEEDLMPRLQSRQRDWRMKSHMSPDQCFDELVEESLAAISEKLHLGYPIELSEHLTAVVEAEVPSSTRPAAEKTNLLLTVDPNAERLFVYATLMDHLPDPPAEQLRLYEALLDGALLGRETAGGTIGISKEDHLVLLSLAVNLRHSRPAALANNIVPFLEAVQRWSRRLQESFPHGWRSYPSIKAMEVDVGCDGGIQFFLSSALTASPKSPAFRGEGGHELCVTDLFFFPLHETESGSPTKPSVADPVYVGRLSQCLKWPLGQDQRISRRLLRFSVERSKSKTSQSFVPHERSVLVEATPSSSAARDDVPRVTVEVAGVATEDTVQVLSRTHSPLTPVWIEGCQKKTQKKKQIRHRRYLMEIGDQVVVKGVILELGGVFCGVHCGSTPTRIRSPREFFSTSSALHMAFISYSHSASARTSPALGIPILPWNATSWQEQDFPVRRGWLSLAWKAWKAAGFAARTAEPHKGTGSSPLVTISSCEEEGECESALCPEAGEAATPSQSARQNDAPENSQRRTRSANDTVRRLPRISGKKRSRESAPELLGSAAPIPHDPLRSVTPEDVTMLSQGETMDQSFKDKLEELLGDLGGEIETPQRHRPNPQLSRWNTEETQNTFGDYNRIPQESVDIYYGD